MECEVILDEEDAPADNDLTDDEAVADAGVVGGDLAVRAGVDCGRRPGLVWWAVTA
ncbi:hypothetical protein GS966_28885 [Rhodococcus hoagii]|nr:hypothetical protein [Prescottella equi]